MGGGARAAAEGKLGMGLVGKRVCLSILGAMAMLAAYLSAAAVTTAAEPPSVDEYAKAVGGQIVRDGHLMIDNVPVRCGHRPTVLDARLNDYGAAFPGFLILNPRLLARVETPVKLWVHAHECGHQYRGPDEVKADCFAVQRGRRYGWLDTDGLDKICKFIRPANGSMMHLSGSQRCAVMRQCFKSDKVW